MRVMVVEVSVGVMVSGGEGGNGESRKWRIRITKSYNNAEYSHCIQTAMTIRKFYPKTD